MECAEPGLDILCKLVGDDMCMDLVVGHLDLIFKWLTLRLCERESVKALQRMLVMCKDLLTNLVERGYTLSVVEATVFIPYVMEKSGQPKPRFKALFAQVCVCVCVCAYACACACVCVRDTYV